jgi:hypothetical protein
MAFVNHFYNATTRKYVALFGTIFNKISITRDGLDGAEVQRMVVPIAYGPFQKFLARITQDPDLTRKTAISLPRMSFEITNMTYDGARKIPSKQKIQKNLGETDSQKSYVWTATPYNLDFSLYIMTNDLDPIDIPIILNGITNEDLYEGGFEERRSVLWTLNFTMKGWYFGPEREKKIIKFIDTDIWTSMDASSDPSEGVNVYPGLTANNVPTTDPDLTIPYEEIQFDDDWGIIRVITSNPEEE